MSKRNTVQFEYLEGLYRKNPEKAGQWYEKGAELRKRSGSVYDEIEALKTAIARKADGADGDYHAIRNNDDLEAASVTMLNPATRRGEKLRKDVDAFREYVVKLIPDPAKRKAVVEMLSTTYATLPDCRRHVVGTENVRQHAGRSGRDFAHQAAERHPQRGV